MWRSIRTRLPRKATPSMLRRRRCSRASSPVKAMRPPAATTRCQGNSAPPYNALTVRRAAPGNPAASATWPYVITFPRGTFSITRRNRASVDQLRVPPGLRPRVLSITAAPLLPSPPARRLSASSRLSAAILPAPRPSVQTFWRMIICWPSRQGLASARTRKGGRKPSRSTSDALVRATAEHRAASSGFAAARDADTSCAEACTKCGRQRRQLQKSPAGREERWTPETAPRSRSPSSLPKTCIVGNRVVRGIACAGRGTDGM